LSRLAEIEAPPRTGILGNVGELRLDDVAAK
jgi:hypothetical protein